MIALALVLAASPMVQAEAEPVRSSLWSGVSYASSVSPGSHWALTVGGEIRSGMFGFGLEGSVFAPGADVVADSRYRLSTYARVGLCTSTPCVMTVSGYALSAATTVCVHRSILAACAVGLGGAGTPRGGEWMPFVSAGARAGIEGEVTESFAAMLNLQLLANLVRIDQPYWSAAPVQLGVTLALGWRR